MNGARPFIDTNVLLYLASCELAKAQTAEDVLSFGGTVSVQVLNEFVSVARRKMLLSWPEIADFTRSIRNLCQVTPLTLALHDHALQLAERYRLPIYDAAIVAAALEAGCDLLLTEDFQPGQMFERRLRVHNPFAAAR
ncbi:PIN domain-containing protein [Pseudoduganella violaceinigra]|uniref:PIN domain-containing protein n=1 Tax=Pseudoduganella violaceinigra TaxID=246602 RepID=UPI0004848FD4|nr:PIN domain-containing protein [Pseudoduganella violaceinigra]